AAAPPDRLRPVPGGAAPRQGRTVRAEPPERPGGVMADEAGRPGQGDAAAVPELRILLHLCPHAATACGPARSSSSARSWLSTVSIRARARATVAPSSTRWS